MTTATTKAAPPPVNAAERRSRMSMKNARHDVPTTGLRVLVYGPDGVGKTTFAAQAPSPIFLDAERGLTPDMITQYGIARTPTPEDFNDVVELAWNFAREEHEHKTLVLDSVDWLQALLFQSITTRASKQSIEDVGGGFQKGYVAAIEEWRRLLVALTAAWEKGLNIIAIAHAQAYTFKNPTGPDFDRWGLKLWSARTSDAAALWREWADDVLYLAFDVVAGKHPDEKRAKGIQTGEDVRVLRTAWSAAWDAKSRHNLPATLPVSWESYVEAVKANRPVDPDKTIEAIKEMAPRLTPERQEVLAKALENCGKDATKLRMLREKVTAEVSSRGAE